MVEAAKKGDMAVVRKQLKAGVAVDAKVRDVTALIKAAEGNQTKMSKFQTRVPTRTRRTRTDSPR